jgi:Rne/Rng family ribonuclease
VIEQTEALVSIDVNGGHGMFGQGNSQEKAILEVNLAAARQIAREIRLRDIGGIIVVDFIDMADECELECHFYSSNHIFKYSRCANPFLE